MPQISIFACEQQPIVAEGLERVVGAQTDLDFMGSRCSFAETLDAIRILRPMVVLVDQAPGLKGALQFISDLRAISPASQAVLWVVDLGEAESFRVLQMGARGVLKKILPVSSLLECVRAVGSGAVWMDSPVAQELCTLSARRTAPRLTPREREIVQCICRGSKNKEIAEKLSITAGPVKVHLMHIFEKTGVKDRFELAIHGRRLMGEVGELEEVGALR